MGVDDSNFEMTFFCAVQGPNPNMPKSLKIGVFKVLEDVASKPVDAALVEAILHQIELHQREDQWRWYAIWVKPDFKWLEQCNSPFRPN